MPGYFWLKDNCGNFSFPHGRNNIIILNGMLRDDWDRLMALLCCLTQVGEP